MAGRGGAPVAPSAPPPDSPGLVSAERGVRRVNHPRQVVGWAAWFAVLGDPSRLMLLVLIARDGPISVSDLAAASGLKATTVSHSLRLLRV
ncbi:winged helix-turn-helix transcriptional regulator [Pseudonocardia sp. KRD-184]|uniref:Winged helix-turn-helix transcriptional regulator n=1 Tax=Pseudonocardia oceani TaxID=2792013 RepID=A0ABS6U3F0_9PSEU|nr:winged helix-turn-helix transcriptional regulator [Pseudonocardia oceani]MBW0098665.1 winged helix-turn-helix transcriptional regulator [Pseudonocardia oceani]MBW0121953.1 winged helix-turn-helix transcriptional regulator [Pseudonocardia oceani]MBW0126493.1 winged helix-turn-helix transcriptional regulator [Pseudonocardia oceani]